MSEANKTQIGGTHYKKGGEEHWDRAFRLKYDCFQYIITKWIERWREKGGLEDLHKARHAINKYIEVAEREKINAKARECQDVAYSDPLHGFAAQDAEPNSGYLSQDRKG